MKKEIVIASNNSGKLKEFVELFKSLPMVILPQSHFKTPEIAETGFSFVENAILKARHAAQHTQKPAIADDSGLIVDYLNGEPGIYSARYSPEQTDQSNNDFLLHKLSDIPAHQRTAHFICVLVYLEHAYDPCPIIAEGRLDGLLLTEARGQFGFGYDPLFWVEDYQKTVAEMTAELKNKISHRANAMHILKDRLIARTERKTNPC